MVVKTKYFTFCLTHFSKTVQVTPFPRPSAHPSLPMALMIEPRMG